MKSILEAFLSKIIIVKSGCWVWIAFCNNKGYGQFNFNKKNARAHRFIYEYFYDRICSDLTIDHLCKVKNCVNPNHLEEVTNRENNLRSNSIGGINSRKTHCNKGHPLSGENLRIENYGGRRCKTCELDRKRRSRMLKKLVV